MNDAQKRLQLTAEESRALLTKEAQAEIKRIEDLAFERGKLQGISIGREVTEIVGPATYGARTPSPNAAPGQAPVTGKSPNTRAAAGGRPVTPTASLEQMFAQSQLREEDAAAAARELTAHRAPDPEDAAAIGREAQLLRAERPSLGVIEAVNEVRRRRGLPERRV